MSACATVDAAARTEQVAPSGALVVQRLTRTSVSRTNGAGAGPVHDRTRRKRSMKTTRAPPCSPRRACSRLPAAAPAAAARARARPAPPARQRRPRPRAPAPPPARPPPPPPRPPRAPLPLRLPRSAPSAAPSASASAKALEPSAKTTISVDCEPPKTQALTAGRLGGRRQDLRGGAPAHHHQEHRHRAVRRTRRRSTPTSRPARSPTSSTSTTPTPRT